MEPKRLSRISGFDCLLPSDHTQRLDRWHGRFGQRRSWLLLVGLLVMGTVVYLGSVDPTSALPRVATAAIVVGIAGATFDIVIDAYRIELLEPRQFGVGAGMSQYGWRVGAASSGALALVISARYGWSSV